MFGHRKCLQADFDQVYSKWLAGEVSTRQACDLLHISQSTFYIYKHEKDGVRHDRRNQVSWNRHRRSIFSANLTALLAASGESNAALARALCTSRQAVGNWVNGISLPTVEMLNALANHFNVEIEELIEPRKEVENYE